MDVIAKLFGMRDERFADFQSRLIPDVPRDRVIGVRTPELRGIARGMYRSGEYREFLRELPHRYFEENNLHAFIICEMRDFDACVGETELFLPHVDNWATCDQLRPKSFPKNSERLLPEVMRWIRSDKTFTVRFGVGILMSCFLDGHFKPEFLDAVAGIESDEYYVNTMCAWYFATALAKQGETVMPYFESDALREPVLRLAVRKACESFRISDERKRYLKTVLAGRTR